jgi:hypothetical protein
MASGAVDAGPAAVAATGLGLGVPAPGRGIQLRNRGVVVEPGTELEYCEVGRFPGGPDDVYYVDEIELAMTEGGHHFILSAAVPGGRVERGIESLQMKEGDQVTCPSARIAFGEDGLEDIGGMQTPYRRYTFADGVGRKFNGGQYVLFDHHLKNFSEHAIEVRAGANFRLTDASKLKNFAREFAFRNWTIDTPPGTVRSFTAECHFKNDVKVSNVSRHTHERGTTFSVWFSEGPRAGEHIWTSEDWKHDIDHPFAEPILMKAGEGFRFECVYENRETYALRFGLGIADEMCVLFGLLWAANDGEQIGNPDCDVIWIDDDGLGHPPTESPTMPETDPLNGLLCLLGAQPLTECRECGCTECGDFLMNCLFDPECEPILGCFDLCAGGASCDCDAVLLEHTSGLGLATQARTCLMHRCDACPKNPGAPGA